MYLESQFSNMSKRKKISEDEKFLNRIIICDEEWLLHDVDNSWIQMKILNKYLKKL